ncbi:MAG TPA: N-6 DNA methylase [Pirellulales bacterium]|nr:N-6 DNA methylase [Pirellulales bacterium]
MLGTQGDAGQFRTPRHIIDFIVAVVDPRKHETVLDPACGTAGFLISAYKHILRATLDPQSAIRNPQSELTPDERARLMTNFCGYDIAPDMVRLSRVNLYLHGFPSPVIHEYDALTSEERWDERYDVIMANPPFMTPKGGIRPHNRFSIHAKRSEVLFVDYIAEHLNPGGRAGVIVPEGIIFQSQNAYKNLRRMLVENYLWAVVSLPGGVFNPYSGVKTSILFLDRNLARRMDDVLFVKVENDGFGLGAQRRPIEGTELEAALRTITAWNTFQKTPRERLGLTVPRKRLLESSDCNLSGDRYRQRAPTNDGRWPLLKLAEVADINCQSADPAKLYGAETFVYLDISAVENGTGQISFANQVKGVDAPSRARRSVKKGDVLLSTVRPNLQAFAYLDGIPANAVASTGFAVVSPQAEKLNGRFLYNVMFSAPVTRQMVGRMGKGAYPSITQSDVEEIEIPLPPLAVQERLVAELDGYRKVIDGARQILANYKPTIRTDPEWPMVELGSMATFKNGVNYARENKGTGIKVIGVADFQDSLVAPLEDLHEINPKCVVTNDDLVHDGDIVFVRSNGNKVLVGRSLLVQANGERVTHSAFTIRLRFSEGDMLPMFYALVFKDPAYRVQLMGRGANINNLSQDILRNLLVPLPPLDVQREIVAELEGERKLVDANRELIARMEKKIQARLAEIWGEAAEVPVPDA